MTLVIGNCLLGIRMLLRTILRVQYRKYCTLVSQPDSGYFYVLAIKVISKSNV